MNGRKLQQCWSFCPFRNDENKNNVVVLDRRKQQQWCCFRPLMHDSVALLRDQFWSKTKEDTWICLDENYNNDVVFVGHNVIFEILQHVPFFRFSSTPCGLSHSVFFFPIFRLCKSFFSFCCFPYCYSRRSQIEGNVLRKLDCFNLNRGLYRFTIIQLVKQLCDSQHKRGGKRVPHNRQKDINFLYHPSSDQPSIFSP